MPVVTPTRHGFGRTVTETIAARAGKCHLRFDPAGVHWEPTAPLNRIADYDEVASSDDRLTIRSPSMERLNMLWKNLRKGEQLPTMAHFDAYHDGTRDSLIVAQVNKSSAGQSTLALTFVGKTIEQQVDAPLQCF